MKNNYLLALLFSLCSPLLFGQQNITGEFQHDGETREYRLHIPPAYEAGMSLPLVINMHGYGSNAGQQELYSGFNTIADTANFFVVYPEGLLDNANSTHFNAYFNSTVDDLGFLSLLIDQLFTDYNIDLSRVYSTGMSNGGFMSYRLACELSDRIAAIASVTGAMTFTQVDNCQPNRAIPVMQIHGTADATVPYNGSTGFFPPISENVDFWIQNNGCDTAPVVTEVPDINMMDNTTASFETYSMCDDNTEVVFYTIENGGHTWPGAFPFEVLGNTNQDFKANETVWRFFNKFTHPSPRPGTIISSQKDILADDLIQAYPNPFANNLVLEMDLDAGMTIELFDAMGRLVLVEHKKAQDSIYRFNTTGLQVGLYYIKVTTDHGILTKKVVKK